MADKQIQVKTKDAIIIGGGPAGASCALWLKLLGQTPCIIEQRNTLGGLQNDSPYPNPWILSIPAIDGITFAEDIHKHILSEKIECHLGQRVERVCSIDGKFHVICKNGESIIGRTVVLASGVKPVTGGIQKLPDIIFGPGTEVATSSFAGKRIAILGGGDNAFENYIYIKSKGASEVRIYARSIKARKAFLDIVSPHDVHIGEYNVNESKLQINSRQFDAIVVLYGWEPDLPHSEALGLTRDSRGFISTTASCQTSVPGIYAIGEVTQRMPPCCVTAMADGIVAAKAIQQSLECDDVRSFIDLARNNLPLNSSGT